MTPFYSQFLTNLRSILDKYALTYKNHEKQKYILFLLEDGAEHRKKNNHSIDTFINLLSHALLDDKASVLNYKFTINSVMFRSKDIANQIFNLPLQATIEEFKKVYDCFYSLFNESDYRYTMLNVMNFKNTLSHQLIASYIVTHMPLIEDKYCHNFVSFIQKTGLADKLIMKDKFYQMDSNQVAEPIHIGNIHFISYLKKIAALDNSNIHDLIRQVFNPQADEFSWDEHLSSYVIRVPKLYVVLHLTSGRFTHSDFIGYVQENINQNIDKINFHSMSVAQSDKTYDFVFYCEKPYHIKTRIKLKQFLKGYLSSAFSIIQADREKNGQIKRNTFKTQLNKGFFRHALEYGLSEKIIKEKIVKV